MKHTHLEARADLIHRLIRDGRINAQEVCELRARFWVVSGKGQLTEYDSTLGAVQCKQKDRT